MERERGQGAAVAERDEGRNEGGVDTGRNERENENQYFVSSRMSFWIFDLDRARQRVSAESLSIS